ncbi:MAG: putative sugar O-methyltransferase [Bacteroidota bacterium]|jgi:putative sugar O-methyltransferase
MKQSMNNNLTNIEENPQLLDLMIADMERAPQEYKPTNYWEYKAKFFLPALTKEGLKDFRRKSASVFSSFGGVDVWPKYWFDLRKSRLFNNRIFSKIPGWQTVLQTGSGIIDTVIKALAPGLIRNKVLIPYKVAKDVEKKYSAPAIDKIEASLVANPEYVFQVNGKNYTNNFVDYYIRYAYCCQFVDFSQIKIIVELGSGSCKLTEVIKKYHPEITFLNFDIAPQLYVGEMYLRSVFPGDVVSYEQNRGLTSLPALEAGKMYFFGAWQFPILKDFSYDLFMNLTSFQEMEPDIVANYIGFINGNSQYVYLHEQMAGKEVAQNKGDFGVMKPTVLQDYIKNFSKYDLIDKIPSIKETGELKWVGHMDTFWKRKE